MRRLCSGRFKTRIRAIDDGTIYDVAGSLEKLAQHVRDERYGKISEAVVVLRGEDGSKRVLEGFFYGIASGDTAYVMLEKMQNRILGE